MVTSQTIREAAIDSNVDFGSSVYPDELRSDAAYRRTLRDEFTTCTTAAALKMGPLRPGPGEFDFRDADAIAEFAETNDMGLRGHTLVWHRQQPDWLEPWSRSDREMRDILRNHIQAVVGRYRGRVDTWDVVNEAIADDYTMRETPWYDALGEEYLDRAFQWAHEIDPEADLYYNDYEQGGGVDSITDKIDAMYDLVVGLLDRDVPIDGVGFQCHAFYPENRPDPAVMESAIHRFQDLDLDVQITEVDVPINEDMDPEAALDDQAEYYRDFVTTCLDAGVETIVIWGFADPHSWLVRNGNGEAPLPFDRKYQAKPAHEAIVSALSDR